MALDEIEQKTACGMRIKQLRLMAGFTRKEFQNKFNINQNTLHAWENGRSLLTKKGALKIITAMNSIGIECSLAWLMDGIGNKPSFSNNFKTPEHLNLYQEKNLGYMENNLELLKEIEFFKKNNAENIVFLISDDGMLPIYDIGDFVGGRKVIQSFEQYSGYSCIIELSDGITIVRKIKFNHTTHTLNAFCLNQDTSIFEPVLYDIHPLSIAPIVWHRRTLML